MPTGPPTNAELAAMVGAVQYEVGLAAWSLHRVHELRTSATHDERLALEATAAVLAALASSRHLSAFFAGDRGRRGDGIVAGDYAEGWPDTAQELQTEVLADEIRTAEQDLAPLSRAHARRSGASHLPDVSAVAVATDRVLGLFDNACRGTEWADSFPRSLGDALRRVDEASST
jgi:hypothetical protein